MDTRDFTIEDFWVGINNIHHSLSENMNKEWKDGNKAAGARARKASLELEKMLKEYRKVSIEAAKK